MLQANINKQHTHIIFGIEKINDKELIDITVLRNINLINRKAEFAI